MTKHLIVIMMFFISIPSGICQNTNIHEKILQNTMGISEILLRPSLIPNLSIIKESLPFSKLTATGFVVKHKNFDILVTANHVLEDMFMDFFYITSPFSTGIYKIQRINSNKQKMWMRHPIQDIAILVINYQNVNPTINSNELADLNYFQGPNSTKIGDSVNSIGYPMGSLIPKLKKGSIMFNPNDKLIKFYADLPTFPGCSGSCVYDDSGRVLGMITACDVSSVHLYGTEIFNTIYLNSAVIVPSIYVLELINNLR